MKNNLSEKDLKLLSKSVEEISKETLTPVAEIKVIFSESFKNESLS